MKGESSRGRKQILLAVHLVNEHGPLSNTKARLAPGREETLPFAVSTLRFPKNSTYKILMYIRQLKSKTAN